MEDQVLKEIKQIRQLLSKLVGTSDQPENHKFSEEAIEKAAKEFKDLSVKRGEWLHTYEIDEVIKDVPNGAGKLLIEKFGFTNYFIRGRTHYFNRKDLVAFNKALKGNNINLKRYAELLNDRDKFEKYVKSVNLPKGTKKKKHFHIPDGLRDISSKPYAPPSEEMVRGQIESLKAEYQKLNLSEYIDLYYSGTYAIFKYIYAWDRYLKPELKRHCKKWCSDFNHANYAFNKIMKFKEENH